MLIAFVERSWADDDVSRWSSFKRFNWGDRRSLSILEWSLLLCFFCLSRGNTWLSLLVLGSRFIVFATSFELLFLLCSESSIYLWATLLDCHPLRWLRSVIVPPALHNNVADVRVSAYPVYQFTLSSWRNIAICVGALAILFFPIACFVHLSFLKLRKKRLEEHCFRCLSQYFLTIKLCSSMHEL